MNKLLMLGAVTVIFAPGCGILTPPSTAVATLRDVAGQEQGLATFRQSGTGMQLTVEVRGLTPGQHGMHVHEFGSCASTVDPATNATVAFGGAGGHFDPGMSGNHDTPQADNQTGHAGDLPMLQVGADGVGRATFTTNRLSLNGTNGILNRSLVIHANPDDYQTDPAGNSGTRVRCGVIQGS